ncbi:peptide-methionine (R)-S-oxide reductase MsrB [Rhizobium sp. YJ-22]|uniref:peptide-methionine (R)-S-oxide reductase MsrB n=1 Tax=Rhizobium sp. YJ-22 TaxID=3037556 RepID=UPI002412C2DE|nr:peptide-methionine (R)-S-oxide reductase MsrB [Rhizobium sp. YJ-22]MDG3580174.1 peptide-methionine (R)-S-oxide reductase MsrB [Rhizobium sp. YJ-22]
MMNRRGLLAASVATFTAGFLAIGTGPLLAATPGSFTVSRSKDEWRSLLTPEQFSILREQGTERPGSSALLAEHRKGTFSCAGCNQALFSSDTKFESGTGWPSFWAPLDNAVGMTRDASHGMVRVEVHCSRCGGHLGHVFNDGPRPTGLRYCMNGFAMTFTPAAARSGKADP